MLFVVFLRFNGFRGNLFEVSCVDGAFDLRSGDNFGRSFPVGVSERQLRRKSEGEVKTSCPSSSVTERKLKLVGGADAGSLRVLADWGGRSENRWWKELPTKRIRPRPEDQRMELL